MRAPRLALAFVLAWPFPAALHGSPAPKPAVHIERMSFGWRGLRLDGRALPYIGGGAFGMVYEIPEEPRAVVKVICGSPYGEALAKVAELDARSAAVFAEAGAGPELLGQGEVSGYPLLVKERVYGDTWEKTAVEGRFKHNAYALALDMLKRLAEAGAWADDLRPGNIMLGRTWDDPGERSLVVDPGRLLPAGPRAQTPEARLEHLFNREVILWRGERPYVGWVHDVSTMREILAEALKRELPKPLLERLQNLKRWLIG